MVAGQWLPQLRSQPQKIEDDSEGRRLSKKFKYFLKLSMISTLHSMYSTYTALVSYSQFSEIWQFNKHACWWPLNYKYYRSRNEDLQNLIRSDLLIGLKYARLHNFCIQNEYSMSHFIEHITSQKERQQCRRCFFFHELFCVFCISLEINYFFLLFIGATSLFSPPSPHPLSHKLDKS